MLLRIVDLRERFGCSDDATTSPPRDGVEVVGNWVDGLASEGKFEALKGFCLDAVCPISIRVSVVRSLSGYSGEVVVTHREGSEREVNYSTDGRRKLDVCRCQRRRKGWSDCENVVGTSVGVKA